MAEWERLHYGKGIVATSKRWRRIQKEATWLKTVKTCLRNDIFRIEWKQDLLRHTVTHIRTHFFSSTVHTFLAMALIGRPAPCLILSLCLALSHGFVRSRTSHILAVSSSRMSSSAADPLESYGLPRPLLLGSASFTRKLILKEMGVEFHKLVRPIDEKALGDRSNDVPADLVLTLAKAKMNHLCQEIQAGRCKDDLPKSNSNTSWVVLTGDQVVTCEGMILEKPESIQEAKDFVSRYATSPPSTVGSCVLTHLPSGIQVAGVDTATIHFRPTIPSDLIDKLLEQNEPILSCAGGLMVEHPLVKNHIDRIDGTEDSVMGLSKDLVLSLLKELSVALEKAGVTP
jgi:septum formation protein